MGWRRGGSTEYIYVEKEREGNPDPENFNIYNVISYKSCHILLVNYPDCLNHGGDKILVMMGQPEKRETLDPHFSDDGDAPVARFEPTTKGKALAKALCEHIDQMPPEPERKRRMLHPRPIKIS